MGVTMERPVLAVLALACGAGAIIWARFSRRTTRACNRLVAEMARRPGIAEVLRMTRALRDKDFHTSLLYGTVAAGAAVAAIYPSGPGWVLLLLVLMPLGVSIRSGRRFLDAAVWVEERARLEQRAEEVLEQDDLAPARWSARLAPSDLPAIPGFEVGQFYQPGTGLMAGDFYDLHPTAPTRVAAVIGDITGHGIEPSITAFQVKYLLRVFLRQFRDPAQVLEEMNALMCAEGQTDELVSLAVVVFDQTAGTLRYASAGHPPAWLWHNSDVSPLRATGPVLALSPGSTYTSREVPLAVGDVLLLYTDGLAEARAGDSLFGEDRVAAVLRRDPGQSMEALCKSLYESARDFATVPITDDIAILTVRRV
jgi:serine phosphatase RsbU (regulator of sigma subunit)